MKKIFTCFLLITALCQCYPQLIEGTYSGAVSREGSLQLVTFEFVKKDGKVEGTYEIPELGLHNVPLDTLFWKEDTLKIKFYYGNFSVIVDQENSELRGINHKWNPVVKLHLKENRNKKVGQNYNSEEISFKSGNIDISGLVFTPKDVKDKIPYVVLVHGSGSQDRFSPYYISLGHLLAINGIGALLYDKRGTGNSTGDFREATFEELAEDAVNAVEFLRSHKNDFLVGNIGLLGTSQGGWVAPLATTITEGINFLILNAGPAVSVYTQDLNRIQYSMISDGWSKTVIDSALHYSHIYFDYAKNPSEIKWKNLKKEADAVEGKEWSFYLNIPKKKDDVAWWIRNDYDPKKILENVSIPVLCLYGELDVLVPPDENTDLMEQYLSKSSSNYKIVTIQGAAHDMKTHQGLKGESWNWPLNYWQWRKQPIEFIETIVSFVKEKSKDDQS